MPARLWELALGGVIALRPAQTLADGRVPAFFGVIIIIAATLSPASDFPGFAALAAVGGAGLLIYAVHGSTDLGWTGKFLRSRPMVFIGLISYSLYLWHWPLLSLTKITHAGSLTIVTRVLILLVATVLAWLSYFFVERPFRHPQKGTASYKVVAAGLAAAIALGFASMTLGNAMNWNPPPTDLAYRTANDYPANRFQCNYREDQSLDDFPRSGCNSAEYKPVRVAIWGDSYALAWQPFAWAIANHRGVAATSYSRDGCPPVLDYRSGHNYLQEQRCREFNKLVIGRIRGIDTLILVARWPDPLSHPFFYTKFTDTLEQVDPLVNKIILLGPTPYLRDSVPQCIAAHDLSACAISRKQFDTESNDIRIWLRTTALDYKNIEYVETTNFFCNPDTCPALKDGYGLYWDSEHVSSTAARVFSHQYLGKV